ncbi:MAG: ABC transporter ATP-binding protein [Pirellulales bacterium]|nr:ABC transporter ATP-binding protein [Pirellulales bacterium]
MSTRAAIEVRGVTYAFGRQGVLRDVSFAVLSGQSVAIRGANGAGKTTLLRCLASAIRPQAGEVRWFGQAATSEPATRRLVGWVAHETHLYSQLTVHENLTFAARMCDVPRPAGAAERWLHNVGLWEQANQLPSRLSRGMRQRAAIARAMLHNPEILLLDEPFSSLDIEGKAWLLDLLGKIRDQGRTICFVAHDRETVAQLAQRVLELHSGRVREVECRTCGTPPALPARVA